MSLSQEEWVFVSFLVGVLVGQISYIALLEYQTRKALSNNSNGGWSIMNAYRDSNRSKREQHYNDKTS